MPFDFEAMDGMHNYSEDPEENENRKFRREHILNLVRAGDMTHVDADRLASEERLGPFAYRPPLKSYDPKSLTSWSIEMVMAWLIFREYDKVAEYSESYRLSCVHWYPVSPARSILNPNVRRSSFAPAWELRPGQAAGMEDIRLAAAGGSIKLHMTFSQAKEDLWRKLLDGKLLCSALDERANAFATIKPQDWLHLDVASSDSRSSILQFAHSQTGPVYSKVAFSSQQIVTFWPLIERAPRGRPTDFDWDVIEQVAVALVQQNAETSYTQAQLIEDLQVKLAGKTEHLINKNRKDPEPSQETLRAFIRKNNIIKS